MAHEHSQKPVVGNVPTTTKVKIGPVPQARQWNFSFKYLRQIELFGTAANDAGWYVSVFEKISDLCAKQVVDVFNKPAEKLRWRLHEIDWKHRGIPIKRADLDWIDKDYLNNHQEFPFWQFSISKALGRIVGFWDENGIFNIVLFDPSHNIQPSKYSDYKTREAPIAKGEFEHAIVEIETRIKSCGQNCGCRNLYGDIQAALTHRLPFSTMLIAMEDSLYARVSTAISSGLADCVSDLLEIAIVDLEELGMTNAEAAQD